MSLQHRGIVYDVGLRFTSGPLSVEPWSSDLARFDIHVIADELGATSIRIEGEDLHRLEEASRIAHAEGLSVFFSPWKMDASPDETRTFVAEAAEVAERLRGDGIDVVFVVACELSIFTNGILPGSWFAERGMWMAQQQSEGEDGAERLAERMTELNALLRTLAEVTRERFSGPITYSAGLWEDVDWAPFNFVGLDLYRHGESDDEYLALLEDRRAHGKPVVIMEVGTCKYTGAGALGDGASSIYQGTNPDGSGRFRDGVAPTRDETEQAEYLQTQLGLLASAGVDGVFVFEFSKPALPTGDGDRDLDIASFSLVSTFAGADPRSQQLPPWRRTEAFDTVARLFRTL